MPKKKGASAKAAKAHSRMLEEWSDNLREAKKKTHHEELERQFKVHPTHQPDFNNYAEPVGAAVDSVTGDVIDERYHTVVDGVVSGYKERHHVHPMPHVTAGIGFGATTGIFGTLLGLGTLAMAYKGGGEGEMAEEEQLTKQKPTYSSEVNADQGRGQLKSQRYIRQSGMAYRTPQDTNWTEQQYDGGVSWHPSDGLW